MVVVIASTPRTGSPVQRILDLMKDEPRRMPTATRVDRADPIGSLRRALEFGALEYFEDGWHIIEEGPTPLELAAIESVVEARASRCITGSAAQSCGAPC